MNVVSCTVSLLSNPIIGSYSDHHGRRGIIVLALLLSIIPSSALVLLIQMPMMSPLWYSGIATITGMVSYLAIIFAALADVVPEQHRATSYGLLLAGFYGGYALAPSVPLLLNQYHTSIFAVIATAVALLGAYGYIPETIDNDLRQSNQEHQLLSHNNVPLYVMIFKPWRDISILNRNHTLLLVSIGSFLSTLVFASDATLLIYYIEDHLNVGVHDIASLFFVLGVFGIILQGGCLPLLIRMLGENRLLVLSFISGTLHNFLYGTANTIGTIYIAMMFSQLTKLNIPLLSSIASQQVSGAEQGQLQGALFAMNSIAFALGPVILEKVYQHTENVPQYGPGFMFIFAAGIYMIGTICVAFIPDVTTCTLDDENDHSSTPVVANEEAEGVIESDGICLEQAMDVVSDLNEPLLIRHPK
jgi:MFS family permease